MRIERVPRQMPPKLPSRMADAKKVDPDAGGERFIWELLTPRLLHPVKLAVVEALLWVREPMSAVGLAAMFEDSGYYAGLLSYHLREMADVGVITQAERRSVRGVYELFFYFPEPFGEVNTRSTSATESVSR